MCCAASTLTYTAAQNALELYENGALRDWPETVLEEGKAQITAVAADACKVQAQQMFRTIATGFEMLARQYPEYVIFRETVHGDQA